MTPGPKITSDMSYTMPVVLTHSIAFLSAFLGFWVQLMVAKSILPLAGGLPVVWIASVLLFQILVLISYGYGTILEKISIKKGTQSSLLLHGTLLLVVSLSMLPLGKPIWEETYDTNPIIGVINSVGSSVGLLFVLLSSNSLMMTNYLKSYFNNQQDSSTKVYSIFATSNTGSLLGLLSYPLLIEPLTTLKSQYTTWSFLYGIVAVLILLITLFKSSKCGLLDAKEADVNSKKVRICTSRKKTTIGTLFSIFSLSAGSCFIFLCATTYFSVALFPMPLVWVLPLGAYLLAWIMAFNPKEEITNKNQRKTLYACGLLVVNALPLPIIALIPLNIIVVYMICKGLHSRIYQLKDKIEGTYAPSICYTLIAVGGITGNILSLLLINRFETSWVFIIGCLTSIILLPSKKLLEVKTPSISKKDKKGSRKGTSTNDMIATTYKYTMLSLILACYWALTKTSNTPRNMEDTGEITQTIYKSQNTLGNLVVDETTKTINGKEIRRRTMGINKVLQGDEILGTDNNTYAYTTLKKAIRQDILKAPKQPKTWMALGLGVGTVASVGEEGDKIMVAEINPNVIKAAQDYFTYIKESKSQLTIKLGDGRKVLEQQPNNSINILICDAYAGSSIPQHMMTKEFFETAKRKVSEGGVIAIHISHSTLNLEPILVSIGQMLGFTTWYSEDLNKGVKGLNDSRWVLFTERGKIGDRAEKVLNTLGFSEMGISKEDTIKYLWTDEFSSILRALKLPLQGDVLIKNPRDKVDKKYP